MHEESPRICIVSHHNLICVCRSQKKKNRTQRLELTTSSDILQISSVLQYFTHWNKKETSEHSIIYIQQGCRLNHHIKFQDDFLECR